MPPLAAGLLAATARTDPALSAALRLTIETARQAPERVVAGYADPAVLGFSLYTWNLRYSLAVAEAARTRSPAALIVVGGPSVPRGEADSERFLDANPAVDVLVLGEGEVAFREILRSLDAGEPLGAIQGLVLRDGAHVVRTPPRPRLTDYSKTASPYLDGTFDALQSQPFAAALLETNRGCPFACTFCDWGQATRSRVHELPLDRVQAEIEWMAAHRIAYIYFVDANFGIRPRDVGITRMLADVRARTGSPAYAMFHLTKNATERNLDTVRTLRAAGIGCQMGLSMQDFDPAVLQAVKRGNIPPERALSLRRQCHDDGIPTFNELLLGLPAQTLDSFCDGLMGAVTPHPSDSFFLYLCRVLENTQMADPAYRRRHDLQTRSCEAARSHRMYDPIVAEREDVVIGTATLQGADWKRAYKFGFLFSAVANLRLLDQVIRHIAFETPLSLRAWADALLDSVLKAPANSALGEVGAVLQVYANEVLSGGQLARPAPHTGDYLWQVTEAVALTALYRIDDFHAEVEQVTRPLLDAADAFQAQRAVTLDWRLTSQDFERFVVAHLAAVYAKSP